MTHREVVERVLNDPEIQAGVEADLAEDPRYVELRRLYDEAAAGLLADLQGLVPDFDELGYRMTAVSDLWARAVFHYDSSGNVVSRRKIDYRAAVPVLLEWSPKVRLFHLAEDIVRALSANFAKKQARPVFFQLFRDVPPVEDPRYPEENDLKQEILRTTIGTALGSFADPSVADEMIELALDRSYGSARAGIVNPGLAKTKDERVPDVLLSLLDDPTVAPQAVQGLGRIRHEPARPPIEQALDSPDENVRYQAKRALKRLTS
ncbi:HEAT repeat domain-containing protein [Amycolatopsis arida]|nr:HEAT repeat domain-containing protein [Amycolatopsis arida]